MKFLKFNKVTAKSALRGAAGVVVAVVLILVKEPHYAAFAPLIPFILRYIDPNEKQMGIAKEIVDTANTIQSKPTK